MTDEKLGNLVGMSETENKILVQRYFDEVTNQANLALVEEWVASDFIDHDAPNGVMIGTEGVKQTIQLLYAAFPDWHATIEDMIAEGDKVVVRNVWRGTHRGEFLGIPPSGKQITMRGIVIWRIENGKLAERWATIDRSELLTHV